LTTELGIVVRTGFIKRGDITVTAASLAVSLSVVSVEVITARKGPVAARNPADMRLLLRVALHMSLEVLLSLEPTFATRLLASELDLFDDGRKIL
jgi:hypothetical protein